MNKQQNNNNGQKKNNVHGISSLEHYTHFDCSSITKCHQLKNDLLKTFINN